MKNKLYLETVLIINRINAIFNKLIRLFSSKDRSFIAMFHDINLDNESLRDDYACSISDFKKFIKLYTEKNFIFISLDSFIENYSKVKLHKKCILTFDDGFESIYTLINPFLIKRQIPYVIYLVPSFIGKDGYLTKEQILELSENPLCTIASHSFNHPKFRFIKKDYALKELKESKEFLENLVKKDIIHFAFPYGSKYACSKKDIKLARKIGYKTVALTNQIPLRKRDMQNSFFLPRINIPKFIDNLYKDNRVL